MDKNGLLKRIHKDKILTMELKFGIGDKVKIVNYGHWWITESGIEDSLPEIVGMEGLVVKAEIQQGKSAYSIHGISRKTAWYSEDQLEMINRNPNR